MNAQIVKLYASLLVLYAVLVGFTSYWSIFDADELHANLANRRPLLAEQRIKRGDIRSSDGGLIARSRPVGSGANRIYVRHYPLGALFGNPIGYSFVERGRVGFELSHNDELVGNQTEFLSIIDQLRGHAQEGSTVVSTLSAGAQRVAEGALSGERGSVVAIEPDSGKVRVMVSAPTYDPNRIPDQFEQLNEDQSSPLFNRATQSGYQPGSTMKVVAATAALDTGEYEPDSVVSGRSPKTISGVPLENFANQSFGDISLTEALTSSVNTVWAEVAEKLGTDTIYKYMDRFGFNGRPPIDYPEAQLAVSGAFEGKRLLGPGDAIDIGRLAIGQERLRVTPLQMAMVAAAVANDGILMQPRLWERVIDTDGREDELRPRRESRVMKSSTAEALTSMMTDVVNEGTGGAAALAEDQVAGKTGTAEIDPSAGINQAWFIGFAPADDPRIAVAATVERTAGGGGEVAAPIAQQVMEVLLAERD